MADKMTRSDRRAMSKRDGWQAGRLPIIGAGHGGRAGLSVRFATSHSGSIWTKRVSGLKNSTLYWTNGGPGINPLPFLLRQRSFPDKDPHNIDC